MFPAEPVPEKIGTYQVVKYVGRTGPADVYVARAEGPLGFARNVNLKMVRFALDDDARFGEELAREAAICARLNHPGVVRMFDFFEHERRLVLVLEQVEGASLDRLLSHLARRKQRLGDAAVFYLGGQVAAALAHAHASTDEDGNLSPVIHRDIKPENVLIGWDGQARLAGFGLGKILGRTPDSIAGTVKGTPGYMSPEQARGERATVRSDVYGFGVLLWSLLGGQEPPTDGSRLTPLGELRPDLPRELVAAIDAALEPSPDRRRITCAELAQWLAKLVRADAGREELRQKVLWLRATRGPASRADIPKQAQPVRRRQAIQAMRQSARRLSSMPAPPSSRRP
ncbi:MAG: serine/threonine protein kinase, partial [Myxococcales bacterium]|nr:serine/threonine protein kinase [Myxococcales bacterium]